MAYNKTSNTDWYALSDERVITHLGELLKQHRLNQNKTQQQLAEEAGIDRATLSQMENGRAVNLITFIQVLRALQLLHELRVFTPQEESSPLQMLREQSTKRMRASHKRSPKPDKESEW